MRSARWIAALFLALSLGGVGVRADEPRTPVAEVPASAIVARADDVVEKDASPARRLGLAQGRRLKSEIARLLAAPAVSEIASRANAERTPAVGAEIPPALRDEIAGVAEGAGVSPAVLLALNAALASWMPPHATETPLPGEAAVALSSSFVALREATSMGQPLHGTVLHAPMGLEEHLLVLVLDPSVGHPLIHVTLPGFVGTLAGMSARGLSATYETFPGPEPAVAGAVAVPFVLRRLLQEVSDLDSGERMLREQPLTTGARIALADGRRGDARIVERYGPHANVRKTVEGLAFGSEPGAGVECFLGACDPEVPRGAVARAEEAARQALRDAGGRLRVPWLYGALTGSAPACLFEPHLLRFHDSLKGPRAPQEATAWRTLELLALLSPERARTYAPPWPVTETGTFTVAPESTKIGDVTITRIAFDSAAPSGHAQNDRVNGILYRPSAPKGALIALPAWKEPNLAGSGLLAIRLANAGYAVLVIPLPWQADRAPPGVSSGSWTLSADLARTRAAMLQGAADIARASLWLERVQGFAPARQGVMGVSLGGHAAALAYGAYPERFAAGVFLLAGGRLETALLHPNRVTGRMRKVLLERGVTAEEAIDLIRSIDGATWANPKRKAGVLIVGADKDDVIPPENVRALAAAYGGARTEWLPGDHMAILLYLPRTIDWVVEHLGATFKSP